MPAKSSMDGRLRSTFGCPSVRKLPYVYEELETPSTLCTPTSSSFVSPCGLGDNSERCSSLPERKAHEGEHKFTESCRHQHSASKRNRQRHLCMQDILCRLESNKSHFRSYAPAVVPSPLRASVLICPGFSFFCTYFFSPYRCIGIFLNLSLSALIPDGREEQSVCSVLVAPCIRSSSCSFLIAVVVASSINANLSLSIFFLPFCSLVSLLHIQYARILRCGYFFADFFVYEIFLNSDLDLACIQKAKLNLLPSGFCRRKTKSQG